MVALKMFVRCLCQLLGLFITAD